MDVIELIDVPTLMALYGIKRIGRNSIARDIAKKLNLTPRTALRKIQSLEKAEAYKLKFTVEYSLKALNLKAVLLIFSDESVIQRIPTTGYFLRATFPVVPFGGGVTFYAPLSEEISVPFSVKDRNFLRFEYTFRLRNKVDLIKYGIRSITNPQYAIADKVFSILRNDVNSFINYLDRVNYRFGKEEEFNSRFMWIDLTIIKELEKKPFTSLEDLANSAQITISKVLKHYRRDVLKILRGIRVRYLPVYRHFDAGIAVKIRSNDPLVIRALGETLVRNPLFPDYGISLSGKEGLVHAFIPFSATRSLLRNLTSICKEFGVDIDLNNLWLLAPGGKRFTIPYIKWEEYIPKVKWNVTLLRQLIHSESRDRK